MKNSFFSQSLPSLLWRTNRGRTLCPAFLHVAPFCITGIVNITPDSFSDGGMFFDRQAAIEHALQLVTDGADSIDFGAESTRPHAEDLGSKKEQERLVPVLEGFARSLELDNLETVVAVDTFRSATAATVLDKKLATVINDVGGGVLDPEMIDIIAQYEAGYVLGHSPYMPAVMQQYAQYDDVVDDLLLYFEERLTALIAGGVPEENIAIDPCIGFAKTYEHNMSIISAAERFTMFGRPVYFGISRKSFLRNFVGQTHAERDAMSQIVTSFLAQRGVLVHRVHNVSAANTTLRLTATLLETGM